MMAEGLHGPQWRRGLGLGWAALVTLALSACATVVPPGAKRGPPPPATPTPRSTPTPEIGAVIPNDQQRHRVALLVPLTGPNAGVGRSLSNSTQLALLDANNDKVRITAYDTATGAAAAAERAIAEGAQLILGPLLADDVRKVAPIARRAGVPLLSFSNDVSVAGEGTYILGYSPSQSIDRVVAYARSQGVTSFGGLMAAGTYGERASAAYARAVAANGGRLVSTQSYERTAVSVNGAALKLSRDGPFDGILIADGGATAAGLVAVLRKNGAGATRILGTELWNAEASIDRKPSLNGAWFASVSDTLYRQYATKYRARFSAAPYRLSSMGYDAVLLIIRIARDWPINARFPEGRLRDRDGFTGIDGAFRFGKDGVAERALEVQEVRAGGTLIVSPAPDGFGGK